MITTLYKRKVANIYKVRTDKLCEDITASDGYFKRFFPLLALLLLALWPVTYAYAHTDYMSGPDAILVEVAEASADSNVSTVSNATSGQAGQVITQEPIHTLSATLASDNVITAPATVLPSHVYVLNNREIVTDKTSSQVDELLGTTEEPSSHREASHCGTIKASVTGAPSRLIVVDENDRIVEIWSNTTGTRRVFYSLRVKEQQPQGPEHPLTQAILARYNRLLGKVDWTQTGQVYSITNEDHEFMTVKEVSEYLRVSRASI